VIFMEEEKTTSKGSTTWIPEPVLSIVKKLQTLRGDEHMSTTVKFLLLKSIADMSFLSSEEKQALGMSETGLDKIYLEQVTPLLERLSSLWNEKCLEYTETLKLKEYKQLPKTEHIAFLYWLKEKNLL
jgi:hypothetical protein